MDQLETRELRYFVAVAEELHFSRAAQRLGIAQPPLSRAIQQLERRLGVTLLARDGGVTLTPAGEVLLHEGRKALEAVAAAGRRAQRAGTAGPRLVLVMKAGADGGLLPDILSGYATEPDAAPVDVLVCGIGEQAHLLRDGRADVGLLHRPYDDTSGFDTEELLVQGQVAVLPARHPLAGRSSLVLADLRGEPLPRWPGSHADGPPGERSRSRGSAEASTPNGQPGERSRSRGLAEASTPDRPPGERSRSRVLAEASTPDRPLVRDSAQLMQLIALGRVVAVLPESVRAHLRRDLVAVPVLDAPPSTVLLAWPARSRSRAIAAFVRAASAVAAARAVPVSSSA